MNISIDDILLEQKDLSLLCRDRVLQTNEIFEPNAYYGINAVIKKYAGLPITYPLKAIFPHGLQLSESYISKAEKAGLLPILYYYSPHRRIVTEARMNKIAMAGASPFLYVKELMIHQPQPDRRGTLFFPAHSTHHITAEMSFELIAEKLSTLDTRFHPITICIYWRDFNLGHHREFENKGFQIVSAGHMYDPLFLYRLYTFCRMHHYSASNEIGTHLFYSVLADCSYFHLSGFECDRIPSTEKVLSDISPVRRERRRFEALFSEKKSQMDPLQLELVEQYAGIGNLKSPSALRSELAFAEKIDRFGFATHPQTGRLQLKVPNLIPRRMARKLKRSLVSKR